MNLEYKTDGNIGKQNKTSLNFGNCKWFKNGNRCIFSAFENRKPMKIPENVPLKFKKL